MIDKYIEKVIRPLLPNAKLAWHVNDDFNLFSFDQLKGSMYSRSFNEDSYFLHFTSVTSLLEILRSKTIRMSDFNSFNDKFELSFANNNLVDDSSCFKEMKSTLFAFSMCEDTSDNLTNEYMWCKYGRNHKGVCIKFKINKDKSKFDNFHLGIINYNYCETNDIIELKELKKRHEEFKKKYNWTINNLDSILLSACSMYKKSEPYSKENEVRLLAYKYKSNNAIHNNIELPIKHKYDDIKNQIQYFLELELEYDKDNYHLPHISIEKIILGKKLYKNTIGQLIPVFKDEFRNSFKRELSLSIINEKA
jgi:hypothetical protein